MVSIALISFKTLMVTLFTCILPSQSSALIANSDLGAEQCKQNQTTVIPTQFLSNIHANSRSSFEEFKICYVYHDFLKQPQKPEVPGDLYEWFGVSQAFLYQIDIGSQSDMDICDEISRLMFLNLTYVLYGTGRLKGDSRLKKDCESNGDCELKKDVGLEKGVELKEGSKLKKRPRETPLFVHVAATLMNEKTRDIYHAYFRPALRNAMALEREKMQPPSPPLTIEATAYWS